MGLDPLDPEQRSRVMAAVRSGNTKPEMVVRRMLHGLGYRYRLHRRDLPGRPDIAFSSRRAVIFVHGCFWHRHDCRAGRSMPASRVEYWAAKFERNVARDRRVREELDRLGWRSMVIWECETRDPAALAPRVVEFLEG